jgi:hypothetical protein
MNSAGYHVRVHEDAGTNDAAHHNHGGVKETKTSR